LDHQQHLIRCRDPDLLEKGGVLSVGPTAAAEKSSEDNDTTWEGYHTKKSVDNLSDSREPFMPVFFRLSTGTAF